MRCSSCNRSLTDSESTRRLVSTGEFLDMCNKCYKDIEDIVPTYNRDDVEEGDVETSDDDFIEEQDYDEYDDGAAQFIKEHFEED